ncbi:MAG: GNAT family N-acetyltransferase [Planctomycetaceae bacterium]|jgi:GNAT superfamily N-acetyltransferase|nr:GNAT family N-acetyltransferase [Planctomycetaceae bacterium]
MTLQVSTLTLEQVDVVVPLFDNYRQFYGQPSNTDGVRTFLSQRLKNGESVIFLAKRNGEACGFTQLYPSFSSVSMKQIWILNDLFVAEEARRKSVGKNLLKAADDFAMTTGACRLVLATGRENLTAQSLYEHAGWVKDELYFHYHHTLD